MRIVTFVIILPSETSGRNVSVFWQGHVEERVKDKALQYYRRANGHVHKPIRLEDATDQSNNFFAKWMLLSVVLDFCGFLFFLR